ncbi:unnamed protein product, partial [Brachionus calyciflorus]
DYEDMSNCLEDENSEYDEQVDAKNITTKENLSKAVKSVLLNNSIINTNFTSKKPDSTNPGFTDLPEIDSEVKEIFNVESCPNETDWTSSKKTTLYITVVLLKANITPDKMRFKRNLIEK